jgi:cell division protein FtsB
MRVWQRREGNPQSRRRRHQRAVGRIFEMGSKISAGEKMTRKQSILISVAVFLLFSLLFFIIFSEHGLVDLNLLKKERDQLAEKNELLSHENLSLSAEIDRLQHDPKYIENIARQELGMVGRDELILKSQSPPKP